MNQTIGIILLISVLSTMHVLLICCCIDCLVHEYWKEKRKAEKYEREHEKHEELMRDIRETREMLRR